MIRTRMALSAAAVLTVSVAGGAASAQLLPHGTQPEPTNRQTPQQTRPASPGVAPASDHPAAPALMTDQVVGMGKLVFDSTLADAGEILDLEPAELNFRFRNEGSGPLTITRVVPSCGCTVPELEKTVYAPNETGTIKVMFDPTGRQGHVSRNIQVMTDSTATPTQFIDVKALVKPVVLAMPGDLLNFESVTKGEEVVRDVKVYGRFPGFEVTRASTNDPSVFDVEVLPGGETEVLGETMYEQTVRVTLKKRASPGSPNASLSIRTNDTRRPIFSVPVLARIIGDLELSPVRMTLGRLQVGDTFQREIKVRHRRGEAFEITHANLNNPAVAAEFTFEPIDPETRTEWIVRASGKVLAVAPRLNVSVSIVTDVEGEEMMAMQMTGSLRP